jgi:hypothetical protein
MGQYYETFYPPFFMDRRYAYDAIAVNSKGYDRDDTDIMNDFKRRLLELQPLDTSLVQVSSEDEVITLKGEVNSEAVAQFLGRVAENILGVRSVSNRLAVARAGASAALNQPILDQSPSDDVSPRTNPVDIGTLTP